MTRIAADVTEDQRTGQPYYLVRIRMTADEIKRLEEFFRDHAGTGLL